MQLSFGMLGMMLLAAGLAWFWQSSLAAREHANRVAMEACERLGLQFLDGTVAFSGLNLVRGSATLLALRRTYVFDYTVDSIERRQGFVVLTGSHVDALGFAPEPQGSSVQAASVSEREVQPQLPTAKGNNVLDLEEWRTRRKRG